MSEKMRAPLFRDKVLPPSDEDRMQYHVAVQICEFNEEDVFLTVWPVCACYDAKTLDFPLDLWEQIKLLVDKAIKDWPAARDEEGDEHAYSS